MLHTYAAPLQFLEYYSVAVLKLRQLSPHCHATLLLESCEGNPPAGLGLSPRQPDAMVSIYAFESFLPCCLIKSRWRLVIHSVRFGSNYAKLEAVSTATLVLSRGGWGGKGGFPWHYGQNQSATHNPEIHVLVVKHLSIHVFPQIKICFALKVISCSIRVYVAYFR